MMNVVDPRKLDQLREIVDCEVAELTIKAPIGRTVFLGIIADWFGFSLEFFKVDDWYVATAQDHITVREISGLGHSGDWNLACDVDVESRFAMSAIARCAEDAAIAIVLRMLDDQVDVFFSPDEFSRYYPGKLAEFPSSIAWHLEWYLRVDVWYQDVPQVLSLRDRDSVVPVGLAGSTVQNG